MKNSTPQNFLRTLHFVWQASQKWTIAKLILLVIQALLPLASLYLMKLVVDIITESLKEESEIQFEKIAWLIAGLGLANLLSAVASNLAQLVSEAQSQLVTDYMSNIVHEKSAQLDLAYYENPKYLNSLHRAQQEAKFRPNQLLNSLTSLLQSGISLIAIGGLLVYLHWATAIILILASVPALLVKLKFSQKMYVWQKNRTQKERESMYLSQLLTFANYAKEVKLFNLGLHFQTKFSKIRKVLFGERMKIARHRFWLSLFAKASEVLAIIGAYGFIAFRTFRGLLTLGDLVMYYQAFQRGQALLQTSLTNLASLYENKLFLQNLFDFLDLETDYEKSTRTNKEVGFDNLTIQFENVSFSYTPNSKIVLENINLEAKQNQVICLVGENGAGKTSLIKLLTGLYQPNEGKVLVNGRDLSEIRPEEWRSQVSVIFQDYIQYKFPAKENIAIGDISKAIQNEKVKASAKLTGADEVIEKLPKKYDSMLGRMFQEGEELSTGQWQKIALARAFYSDAKVIVLDEPTSSMDALAEYQFFQQLKSVAKDKIIFLISHRLSSATMSDKIYFLEHGEILESGSHIELVKQNGKYAKMFNRQAELYRN
ncbi:MAG: ATP-binding cassette subfamily B protein [Flammeovirgaceae bacterium]